MTVKQLIKKLKAVPKQFQEATVRTFDGEWGYVGISRVSARKRVWDDGSISRWVEIR